MSATTRDVTISVQGVPFVVTVLVATDRHPHQPKPWGIRVAGSGHELSNLLACEVVSEIEKRIKGGIEHLEDPTEIPFEVPTPAGGQS